MGNRLKEARKRKGLNQTEVAKYIGLTQGSYSLWESGKTKIEANSLAKLADLFGVTTDYLLGTEEPTPRRKRIPVLGHVAAGIPIDAITDVLDFEEVDDQLASLGELFGLRIKGSSMEPRIKEGDVVICHQTSTCNTGDTCIVLVAGDSATCKRIKKEENGIWLIPNNPAYDSKFYSTSEIEQLPVRIIGKVVELRGKF